MPLRLYIYLSLLAALVLSVWPLPEWLEPWWPQWLPMVVVFWVIQCPKEFGYATVWIFGLLSDFVFASLMGTHVLGYSIILFLCGRFAQVLSFSNLLWQIVPAAVLITGYLVYIQFIVVATTGASWTPTLWSSLLTSLVLWPFLHQLLTALQRRSGYEPSDSLPHF